MTAETDPMGGFTSQEAYARAKMAQAEIVVPAEMDRFVGKRVGPIAAQHWKPIDRIAWESYLQGILDAAQRELFPQETNNEAPQ